MDEVARQMEAATPSPLSGTRPLAALVQHLMEDPAFDPFDVVRAPRLSPSPWDIPAGEQSATEYADLQIRVDFGAGSPGSMNPRRGWPEHAPRAAQLAIPRDSRRRAGRERGRSGGVGSP